MAGVLPTRPRRLRHLLEADCRAGHPNDADAAVAQQIFVWYAGSLIFSGRGPRLGAAAQMCADFGFARDDTSANPPDR